VVQPWALDYQEKMLGALEKSFLVKECLYVEYITSVLAQMHWLSREMRDVFIDALE
jgi:hypothetical protein